MKFVTSPVYLESLQEQCHEPDGLLELAPPLQAGQGVEWRGAGDDQSVHQLWPGEGRTASSKAFSTINDLEKIKISQPSRKDDFGQAHTTGVNNIDSIVIMTATLRNGCYASSNFLPIYLGQIQIINYSIAMFETKFQLKSCHAPCDLVSAVYMATRPPVAWPSMATLAVESWEVRRTRSRDIWLGGH